MLKARLVTYGRTHTRYSVRGASVVSLSSRPRSPLWAARAFLHRSGGETRPSPASPPGAERDDVAVKAALDELRRVTELGDNVMPASIALAKAGGTTGEWGALMREVFGEYRAPTGVGSAQTSRGELTAVAEFVRTMPGGPPKLLVAKPGLDGHSNGAEQIAVAARDAGMEVVYAGIRLTPEQIAASARDEDPDVIGISILSGAHLELVPDVIERCRAAGVDAAVVVGGIIPEEPGATARSRCAPSQATTPDGGKHARYRRDGGSAARPRRTAD